MSEYQDSVDRMIKRRNEYHGVTPPNEPERVKRDKALEQFEACLKRWGDMDADNPDPVRQCAMELNLVANAPIVIAELKALRQQVARLDAAEKGPEMVCVQCGQNPAARKDGLCEGCEAYEYHTR